MGEFVIGSVENPDWSASLFDFPHPWHCDEIMPSPEDMQALQKFTSAVSCFFLNFVLIYYISMLTLSRARLPCTHHYG